MDDFSYWLVFFTAALALNLSPGPDLMYVLSRTVAQGTRVGLASAAGVSTGALVHVAAASVGLSALLATSAAAFSVVKYVGAAYLVYLGVQALRSKGSALQTSERKTAVVKPWQAFRQGVLVGVLNPGGHLFHGLSAPVCASRSRQRLAAVVATRRAGDRGCSGGGLDLCLCRRPNHRIFTPPSQGVGVA